METIKSILRFLSDNPIGTKMIWTLIAIVISMVISRVLVNISYKILSDNKRYYPMKQSIKYITGVLIVICIMFIWLDSIGNLTTYIGLLSAGIAIALKEIFINMAGWLFIEVRKPFTVGDRVLIGTQKGDVIDKRMFQFSLMEVSSYEDGEQSTGRIVDVPNSFVFVHPIINYTKGFEYIWNEVKVLLTFESDWKKAKELLLAIANRDTDITSERVSKQIKTASKRYMIHYNNLTPIVYVDVKESGVQLSIRYLCEPKQRRTTINKIWEDILVMLDKHEDIELAYPTKRVVD